MFLLLCPRCYVNTFFFSYFPNKWSCIQVGKLIWHDKAGFHPIVLLLLRKVVLNSQHISGLSRDLTLWFRDIFTLRSVRHFSRPLWERRLNSPGRLFYFWDLSWQQLFLSTGAALTGQASIALALRKLGDRVHLLNLLVTQLKKKVRLAFNTKVVQAFLQKNQFGFWHRCRLWEVPGVTSLTLGVLGVFPISLSF